MLASVLDSCQTLSMKNTQLNKKISKDRENLRQAMILICRILPGMSWESEADDSFRAYVDATKFARKMSSTWNK